MLQNIATWGTLAGTLATALATFFLWRVTRLLAVETKRMADSAAQPMIVANITPNQWSTIHFDITIQNTGNATAFDIRVVFDPPLTKKVHQNESSIPFQNISLLKPGQELQSFLGDVATYLDQDFRVLVSWKLSPTASRREELAYDLKMSDWNGVSYLGARSPLVQLAEQVKNLREDWRAVARGSQRVEADVFNSEDRAEERRIIEERIHRSAVSSGSAELGSTGEAETP